MKFSVMGVIQKIMVVFNPCSTPALKAAVLKRILIQSDFSIDEVVNDLKACTMSNALLVTAYWFRPHSNLGEPFFTPLSLIFLTFCLTLSLFIRCFPFN